MTNAFISYDDKRAELAQLLADYLKERGQAALLVSRDEIKRSGDRSGITAAMQKSVASYVIAEPDDVGLDPLVVFTIGVANACDIPVKIVSLADAIEWPVEIINELVKVIGYPEKIAARVHSAVRDTEALSAVS